MKKRLWLSDLFIQHRLYWALSTIALMYVISFHINLLFGLASVFLLLTFFLILLEYSILFAIKDGLQVSREVADVLSLGDRNEIHLIIQSTYSVPILAIIYDEIPVQFQERNFNIFTGLKAKEKKSLSYLLIPKKRGEYEFGQTHIYVSTKIGLLQRRYSSKEHWQVKVYPSYLKLKQYSLHGITSLNALSGSKKIRKAASTEFDQIKDYVPGDDVRTINWKASARRSQLMVNTYNDEKAQQVFCLIDKSRLMKMPFNGISLLDYSINASLLFTYIALHKGDKVGLLTFSKQVDDILKASKSKKQFSTIVERLYKQETDFMESNYEEVQYAVKREIGQRSLLFLFTNFETYVGFERKLPYFKMLSKKHLLCVILFENTELKSIHHDRGNQLEDVYIKTIADKYHYEKRMMLKELRQNGILSIYSTPEDLSINVVNKYLDLKTKRFL